MFALGLGYVLVVACAFCGLIALAAPARFARVARFWGMWIETRPKIPFIDSRIDVDAFAVRHSRVFGAAVFAAAIFWGTILASS